MPGALVKLGEFVSCAREADLESFGFAEPAFVFRFADAGDKIVSDVDEALSLGGISAQSGQRTQLCSWMQLVP